MDMAEEGSSIFSILVDLFKTLWVIAKIWLISIFRFFVPSSEKNIEKKVILITGGGNGIGRIMACELAAKGAIIVSWDVKEEWNFETQNLVEKLGGIFKPFTVNVRDRNSVILNAERVLAEIGPVDILVNNAGVVSGQLLTNLTEENIRRTFEVNVLAHFWTLQAFLPSMISRGHGHIVSIASIAGFVGASSLSDYCSSKFAAVGLHESLVNELFTQGHTGINTTLVCPFHITTGLFDGMKARFIPSLEPEYVAKRIVMAILTNQRQVMIGRDMYILPYLKSIMPVDAITHLFKFMGDGKAMKNFVGRSNKSK